MKSRREYPTVVDALAVIRQLDRTHVKRAELGGDGQDVPFEQAFSNLAHAYLRDKAPSLLDHELGFQLLDRNQENTKAVGVFGFKVGSHMLFAPVFFLQGDLKGHELLYIKNQDLFVPLKENWLNYILNRKPNIIGSSVSRNTAELGVQQPNLNRLSQSPWKTASAMPHWVQEVLPKFCHTATLDTRTELEKHASELNLPRYCREFASLDQLRWLTKTAQQYPAIARTIEEHHGGLDFLSEAIRAAGQREKSAGMQSVLDARGRTVSKYRPMTGSVLDEPPVPHPVKTGALKVIEYDATQQTELPEAITEDDKEELLRDGLLIKDHRKGEQVSVPYNVMPSQKLFNPTETGLYMVLVKPGGFEKCFVSAMPHGNNGRVNFSTVVRLDGPRNWINCHPSRVWAASRIEGPEYDEWVDSLPEANSLSSDGGRHLLIGQRGNATLPFKVEKTLGDERGGTVYEVNFSDHCQYGHAEHILHPDSRDSFMSASGDNAYSSYRDGERLHLKGKQGTQMRSNRGDVWIPEGAKKLTVKPAKSDSYDDDYPCCGDDDGGSENPPIRPGNLIDAELQILTKVAEVRIKHAGVTVTINDRSFNERGALVHLVRDHGLRAPVSQHILKQARDKGLGGSPFVFHVKHAAPFQGDPYLTGSGPGGPNFPDPMDGGPNMMGFPGQTISQSEYSVPVPGMEAGDNRGAYDVSPSRQEDPMDFASIQKAISSGQKEVFDTAMIGSMLKAVREDTMIDKYIPDLLKGMDRLGRLLFMFYWHMDTFAERYGKQDLPELEDTLRNSFEMLGDTVLFLKQKTIEPYPEEDSVELNLSGASA